MEDQPPQVHLAWHLMKWNKTIIWTPSCRRESIKTWVSCGFNTFHLVQQLVSMLLTFKMNSIRNFKSVKQEKLVFVQSVKSCTHKHSTKSSDKLLSTVLREVFFLLEFVMKSKWLFKLIRLCTKVQLHMVWENHLLPNKVGLQFWWKSKLLKVKSAL